MPKCPRIIIYVLILYFCYINGKSFSRKNSSSNTVFIRKCKPLKNRLCYLGGDKIYKYKRDKNKSNNGYITSNIKGKIEKIRARKKENYYDYFKQLDKLFNECDYDVKEAEEEEKKREKELNALTEKDLDDINFANYENDPRSQTNLVRDKTKEEIEEDEKNKKLQYSYDYDRILKKKFLPENIEYKNKFQIPEKAEQLVENVGHSYMNNFLNHYEQDFDRAYYKGGRDKWFGREDIVQETNTDETGEEKTTSDRMTANDSLNEKEIIYDDSQLESVHFLQKVRNELNEETSRDSYIEKFIGEVKKEILEQEQENRTKSENENGDSLLPLQGKYADTNSFENEKQNHFEKYVKDKIKEKKESDVLINDLMKKKYQKMFQLDKEVLAMNEQIKTSETVDDILLLFQNNKRPHILNVMYALLYISRFKILNIDEYIYDQRFSFLTNQMEQLFTYYMYNLREKEKDAYIKKNDKTIILKDTNFIFLLKYMNRLKLFYINLNIYNLLFLILAQSLNRFTVNSLLIMLGYLNEYTYYGNTIHKKINLSILQHIFYYLKKKPIESLKMNINHFRFLLPLLIKYKFVDNETFTKLYTYFENDINKILEFMKSDETLWEDMKTVNHLFYEVKTKEQKQNKENYISYLQYNHMIEKKKNMKLLLHLLQYLMIFNFDKSERILWNLINLFKDNFSYLDMDDLLNIFFRFYLFQNKSIDVVNKCKQEILRRKSMLKDYQLNKILAFFVHNYRKALFIEELCNTSSGKDKKYTIFRRRSSIYKNIGVQDSFMRYYMDIANDSTDKTTTSSNSTSIRANDRWHYFKKDTFMTTDINRKSNIRNDKGKSHSAFSDSINTVSNTDKDVNKAEREKVNSEDNIFTMQEIKQMKEQVSFYKAVFKDSEFIYDLTHNIHIYLNFRNVHMLKFIYNMYLLSLLFYKNHDVKQIIADLAYSLMDTSIFSFIDQYSYYLKENIDITIKAFKYISFFNIDLIDLWKKLFFLLPHFVNALTLENIYDLFFFIKVANITNLKNENYDVITLVMNRMKHILKILENVNIRSLNTTNPHSYILHIMDMIEQQEQDEKEKEKEKEIEIEKEREENGKQETEEKQKERGNKTTVDEFARFFFYSIYQKINRCARFVGEKNEQTQINQANTTETYNEIIAKNVEQWNEIYKQMNYHTYNIKDIVLFLSLFLKKYKKKENIFTMQILDFALYNLESFFLTYGTNKDYMVSLFTDGDEINQIFKSLQHIINERLYNRNIRKRCIHIMKWILNICKNLTCDQNIYNIFLENFQSLSDINIWKFILKQFSLLQW